MLSILGFLLILGPLVIVHEFGHYIFARIFGVKAEIFSVGFGPTLWSKLCGETEVRVSVIPLGGYVKLLGEDRDAKLSPEDQKRALQNQAAWKRFFIFFGGPLFNFLFAILVFMAILLIGEPQVASVASRVVHGSVAEKAGFQSGDRILKVDGKPVRRFDEVLQIINERPGQSTAFTVIHPGMTHSVDLAVVPGSQEGFSVYGESKQVGEIDGLLPNPRSGKVGISDPRSLAGKAGIVTGDMIVEMSGKPVVSWEEIERNYRNAPAGPISLKLKREDGKSGLDVSLSKPEKSKDMSEDWGLHSSELFVQKAVEKSPAEEAGIRKGDRLIGVGNIDVESFFDLRDSVQKAGEKEGSVKLRWEREGKIYSANIKPTANSGRDPLLKKTVQYTVGVMPMLVWTEPPMVIDRILNPFVLLYKGTERMVTFSWRNLLSLQKMFTGDVSVNTLGGPIMIGIIAGESLTRGLIAFLTTMAILSIGLGVLNVLPVPVLDGGHLLLLGVEVIRGKPLTMRQMEIIQVVGLSLILILMGIVIRNDLVRLL